MRVRGGGRAAPRPQRGAARAALRHRPRLRLPPVLQPERPAGLPRPDRPPHGPPRPVPPLRAAPLHIPPLSGAGPAPAASCTQSFPTNPPAAAMRDSGARRLVTAGRVRVWRAAGANTPWRRAGGVQPEPAPELVPRPHLDGASPRGALRAPRRHCVQLALQLALQRAERDAVRVQGQFTGASGWKIDEMLHTTFVENIPIIRIVKGVRSFEPVTNSPCLRMIASRRSVPPGRPTARHRCGLVYASPPPLVATRPLDFPHAGMSNGTGAARRPAPGRGRACWLSPRLLAAQRFPGPAVIAGAGMAAALAALLLLRRR